MPEVYPHVEVTPGVMGGRPRVVGRRIAVADVAVWHEQLRMTADEISDAYDLSLADVHGALTYYFDHRDAIDRQIAEADALADALRTSTPSKIPEALRRRTSGAA